MNSNVIVVGGSGYIGTHLQLQFPKYIYTSSKDFDLNNKVEVELYFKDKHVDTCIILASKISYEKNINIQEEPFQSNVHGLNNLLQVLSQKQYKPRIIYFSSMTVYDINNKIPVSESDNLLPLHGYGMSKVWAESLIKYYRLPSLIIRIPGVYGGKRTQGFIYNTIKALKNNEDIDINTEDLGYWETIHIDDLIYLFNSLMNQYSYKKDVEVFNISYGEVTDFIQTANFIKNEIASNSVIKINKCYQNYYLCNKKLLSYTTPEYSYYNRLKKYIQEVTK